MYRRREVEIYPKKDKDKGLVELVGLRRRASPQKANKSIHPVNRHRFDLACAWTLDRRQNVTLFKVVFKIHFRTFLVILVK